MLFLKGGRRRRMKKKKKKKEDMMMKFDVRKKKGNIKKNGPPNIYIYTHNIYITKNIADGEASNVISYPTDEER